MLNSPICFAPTVAFWMWRMRHPWRLLNPGSKHIFLNIRMIAANTLNTCTVPFPSAELRRFMNRLIIIIIINFPSILLKAVTLSTETVLSSYSFHKSTTLSLKNFCPNVTLLFLNNLYLCPQVTLLGVLTQPLPLFWFLFSTLYASIKSPLCLLSPVLLVHTFSPRNSNPCSSESFVWLFFVLVPVFHVLFKVWIPYLDAVFQLWPNQWSVQVQIVTLSLVIVFRVVNDQLRLPRKYLSILPIYNSLCAGL